MIIVTNNTENANKIMEQSKEAGLKDVFQHNNRIGFAHANNLDDVPFEIEAEEVITKHPAAIQASRLFHPENTVIRTKHSVVGDGSFTKIAGPDSIESPEHVLKMGRAVKEAGGTMLRGGSFKPRTNPYTFQGNGETGLKAHRAAADALDMDMVTEIMDTRDIELVDKYTDIFQVGTRNMQNFALLKALGKLRKPVILKRGMSATIDDLLNASEYIAAGGNTQIMLMERGIRTFDNKYTRNTMDVSAIPVLKKLTHYPILADSSHAAGVSDLVTPIGISAVAAGADGLMTEIHDHPEQAFVDGKQALTPEQFKHLASLSDQVHDLVKEV
ncbi:3-deoxy-7-phosphoheptulonate synthase [Companilactobacillus insicii]|uniref:3-deoxy-7-phosphoheptulonate synthase n=1 Tax=Companilactobacillus insicii TaxID=1732567 RepID=UPI000F76ABDE|nr:3-deoxy-7-phosphoheptulonate synthase [Companilactobacillus insicii]